MKNVIDIYVKAIKWISALYHCPLKSLCQDYGSEHSVNLEEFCFIELQKKVKTFFEERDYGEPLISNQQSFLTCNQIPPGQIKKLLTK